MRTGRYDRAVSIYKELVKEHPSEDSFLLHLAWAYHDSGALFDAIDCFEQLFEKELRQDIFTGFAYDELFRIFKTEHLHERLVTVCEKAVKAQPEDTGYLNDLADAYAGLGLFEKAADTYRRMIDVDPVEADFYCRLGSALIRAGDWTAAEDAYGRAVEMEKDTADVVYYKLSDAYSRAGLEEKAETAQRKGLTFCQDNPLYYLNLSDILARQERYNEAHAVCEQAVHLNPANGAACFNRLGNTLLRAGFHEAALKAFLQAVAMDPENPFFYFYLAECCRALGRNEEADRYLEQSERYGKKINTAPAS